VFNDRHYDCIVLEIRWNDFCDLSITAAASKAISVSAAIARSVETRLNLISQATSNTRIGSTSDPTTIRTNNDDKHPASGEGGSSSPRCGELHTTVCDEPGWEFLDVSTTTTGRNNDTQRYSSSGCTNQQLEYSTIQDLQSAAAAPQLATTTDPIPATDPAIPWSNKQERNQGLQNLFIYP